MRVAGKAAAGAVAALLAGLLLSFVGAAWLRSAVPQAGLVWDVASPAKVAVWTLAGAHGVDLHLEAGVEVDDRLQRVGDQIDDTIGGLLGRDDGVLPDQGLQGPSADLDVRLSSLTVLAFAGVVMSLVARASGARSFGDVAVVAASGGVVYGIVLSALTATASAELGFDARIVSAGVEASMSPVIACVLGLLWGAAFAAIGALSSPAVAEQLSRLWRAIGAGMLRAAVVSAAAAAVGLVVLAVTQSGGGAPGVDPSLAALGAIMLGVNAVVAAVVVAHGPIMQITLDAGPLAEWSQIGYVTQGDESLSPARWLFVLVPLLGGVAAGRAMRKRSGEDSPMRVAAVFGVLWGIALMVLTLLLRVRVLSSFSLGSLDAGGGVAIDPLITFVLAAVWGGITAYIGLVMGGEPAPAEAADERVPVAMPPVPASPPVAPRPAEPVAPRPVAPRPVEPRPVEPVAPGPVEPRPVEPRPVEPVPQSAPAVSGTSATADEQQECASCGRSLPAADRFCMWCGQPVG